MQRIGSSRFRSSDGRLADGAAVRAVGALVIVALGALACHIRTGALWANVARALLGCLKRADQIAHYFVRVGMAYNITQVRVRHCSLISVAP